LAGIPWYLDAGTRTYRVRPEFRCPLLAPAPSQLASSNAAATLAQLKHSIAACESQLVAMRQLVRELERGVEASSVYPNPKS
ncbi:MAG: hypothetical protein ACKPEY_14235, partial [Planctomycetota bacterium]